MQLTYKRIVYSLLAFIIFFVLIYFIGFNNKPEGKFGAAAIFLLLRYAALWVGLAILACRIISLIKNYLLVYIVIGVLNIILAVIAIALYFSGHMVMQIMHLFLLNLLLGSIIMLDALFFKKIF